MSTPSQRVLAARVGAHSLHAGTDSRQVTKRAREKFLARFDDEVDPDRVLPVAERARRAEHARKAYFARLALKSLKARAKGAGGHV